MAGPIWWTLFEFGYVKMIVWWKASFSYICFLFFHFLISTTNWPTHMQWTTKHRSFRVQSLLLTSCVDLTFVNLLFVFPNQWVKLPYHIYSLRSRSCRYINVYTNNFFVVFIEYWSMHATLYLLYESYWLRQKLTWPA